MTHQRGSTYTSHRFYSGRWRRDIEPIPWLCGIEGVSHGVTARVCGLIPPQQYWFMSYQSGKWCVRDWGDNADGTTQPRRTAATTLALILDVSVPLIIAASLLKTP